jgi:predicted O-methyltransferase YrrM
MFTRNFPPEVCSSFLV